MERKRIGFVKDSSDEVQDNSKHPASSDKPTDKECIVKGFITAYFCINGDTKDKEFRTSAELAYMMREYGAVPAALVSKVMAKLQYRIKFIDGVPNWIVFMKDQDDYTD